MHSSLLVVLLVSDDIEHAKRCQIMNLNNYEVKISLHEAAQNKRVYLALLRVCLINNELKKKEYVRAFYFPNYI